MTIPFAILAVLTMASAVAAMGFRHLVHCALALVVTFVGLAALFLQLDAPFVGFAQILVYVGAVAILVVFAILLTRSGEPGTQPIVSAPWLFGLAVAALVFATLAGCVLASGVTRREAPPTPNLTVRQIGDALMTQYVLPLEVLGLLLTAAMIGAVILAMKEKHSEVRSADSEASLGPPRAEASETGPTGQRPSAIANSP